MLLIYMIKFSGAEPLSSTNFSANLLVVFVKKAGGGTGVFIVIRSISRNNYRRQ